MSKKDKREKRKIRYSDTTKVIENKEKGWAPTAFKVPQGMEVFKFKEDKKYRLDFLPYLVKNNPYADVKKGDYHYERTYFTHPIQVGGNTNHYACLQKNFGKKCPVCELSAKQAMKGASKEMLQKLKPKERQLFVVRDRDSEDKKLMIFECGHYKTFGEMLLNKLDGAEPDSPIRRFHSLDEGSYLVIKSSPMKFEGRGYFGATNIEMTERTKPIPEAILDKVPCLDELIIEMEYKKLKKLLESGVDSDEEDDEEDDEDEDQDDQDDEEGDEEEKPRKKKKGKKADEDDEDSDEDDDDGDEDDEEGDEDDAGDSDDDDDEDDEESDEVDWEDNIGRVVTFKRKGKKKEGTITKVKGDMLLVKVKGLDKPIKIEADDATLVDKDDDDSDDDDDEWDDD